MTLQTDDLRSAEQIAYEFALFESPPCEGDMLVGFWVTWVWVCFGLCPWRLQRSFSTSFPSAACCSCSDPASCCAASSAAPWPLTGCGGAWSACTCRRWPRGFCKSGRCRWDTAAGPSACGSAPGCSGSPRRCSSTTCRGGWSSAWGARGGIGPSTPALWRAWRCGRIRRWCNGWSAAPCSSALRHLGGRWRHHS